MYIHRKKKQNLPKPSSFCIFCPPPPICPPFATFASYLGQQNRLLTLMISLTPHFPMLSRLCPTPELEGDQTAHLLGIWVAPMTCNFILCPGGEQMASLSADWKWMIFFAHKTPRSFCFPDLLLLLPIHPPIFYPTHPTFESNYFSCIAIPISLSK